MKNFIFAILFAGVSLVACETAPEIDGTMKCLGDALYALGVSNKKVAIGWDGMATNIQNSGKADCMNKNAVEQSSYFFGMALAIKNVVDVVGSGKPCPDISDSLNLLNTRTDTYQSHMPSCKPESLLPSIINIVNNGDIRGSLRAYQGNLTSVEVLTNAIVPPSLYFMAFVAMVKSFAESLSLMSNSANHLSVALKSAASSPSTLPTNRDKLKDEADLFDEISKAFIQWYNPIIFAGNPDNAFAAQNQMVIKFLSNLKELTSSVNTLTSNLKTMNSNMKTSGNYNCLNNPTLGSRMQQAADATNDLSDGVDSGAGISDINALILGVANANNDMAAAMSACDANDNSSTDNSQSMNNYAMANERVAGTTARMDQKNLYSMAWGAKNHFNLTMAFGDMATTLQDSSDAPTQYSGSFKRSASAYNRWLGAINEGSDYYPKP